MLILEDIIDNISHSVDSEESTSKIIASNPVNPSDMQHKLEIEIIRIADELNYSKTITLSQFKQIDVYFNYILDKIPLFDEFVVRYWVGDASSRDNSFDEAYQILSGSSPTISKNIAATNPIIVIYYNTPTELHFDKFCDSVVALFKASYSILSDSFGYRLNARSIQITIQNTRLSKKNLTKSELEDPYIFLFSTYVDSIYKHPLKVSYSGNKGIVVDDDFSTLTVGDFLYYDSLTQKLTINETRCPVAQFIYKNEQDGTYRFASLKYMSLIRPTSGNIRPSESIPFGNVDGHGIISRSFPDEKDGAEFTAAGVLYINDTAKGMQHMSYDYKKRIEHSINCGYMPAIMAAVSYRTPGTKSGEWYLPTLYEMKKIHMELDFINEERKQKNIEEIAEFLYTTSIESSNSYNAIFDMGIGQSQTVKKTDIKDDMTALAFLKVISTQK